MQEPGGHRVLVVEDDPHMRALEMVLLESSAPDWHVQGVETMAEALAVLEREPIDVVLLDLGLPDSYGLGGLEEVRRARPGTAVVVVTGSDEYSTALKALSLGAQEYLDKGRMDGESLYRVVHYALGRVQAEETLRVSQDLLASTLDALPACIGILDELGFILAVNAKWKAYEDPDNRLLWNCPVGSNYLPICEAVLQEGEVPSEVARAMVEILAGLSSSFRSEYRVGGGGAPKWFELGVTRFERHGVVRVVVAHREITAQKVAEQGMRRSEELFRIITENAQDLIAILDPSGQRIYHSPAYPRMLGYSEEELARMGPLDAVAPEDGERIRQALEALVSTGQGQRLEYRMRKKDGEWVDLESYGVPIRDPSGALAQILIMARDITSRKKAEREHQFMEIQLRHAQKLESIGQLAAGIAHEINTPIQYIGDNGVFLQEAFQELMMSVSMQESLFQELQKGTLTSNFIKEAEACLRKADLPYLKDEIPKAIRQSMEGVQRVSKIVSAMKDFSHPGGEEKVQVDLNRAIQSTLTVSRNEWKYVAEMETRLDPDLPMVFCLPGEFNQVILNLVVNAAHAIADVVGSSGGKGRIVVSTRSLGDQVEIRVEDTGSGIPEALRSRIFDPFFTTKPVGKGTGQGLAIVHSAVVENHKGTLTFESEPGRGTTFVVCLPIVPPADPPALP